MKAISPEKRRETLKWFREHYVKNKVIIDILAMEDEIFSAVKELGCSNENENKKNVEIIDRDITSKRLVIA